MNNSVKKFKGFLKIFLALVLSFGMFSAVKPDISASAATAPATLTIFSDGSGDAWGTHAFLSLKNNKSTNTTVLGTTLRPGYSMTIGTFGNKSNGKGIYTNLEAYFIKNYNAYRPRVSLSMNLSATQLNTVINTMANNNKWTLTNNCAWFASKVWNSVASKSMKLSDGIIPNPNSLSKNIKKKSGYRTGASVGTCDTSNVRRVYGKTSSSSVSSATKKWSSSGSSKS